MAIYKMGKADDQPPTNWPVEHEANVGYDEPFVRAIVEIIPVVGAGTIPDDKRKDVKHAITSILMDGLTPAFLELQQIRASYWLSPSLKL